jgi:hypothetical protein
MAPKEKKHKGTLSEARSVGGCRAHSKKRPLFHLASRGPGNPRCLIKQTDQANFADHAPRQNYGFKTVPENCNDQREACDNSKFRHVYPRIKGGVIKLYHGFWFSWPSPHDTGYEDSADNYIFFSAPRGFLKTPSNPSKTQPDATSHAALKPNPVAMAPRAKDPSEIPESNPRK